MMSRMKSVGGVVSSAALIESAMGGVSKIRTAAWNGSTARRGRFGATNTPSLPR